jgi:transcriptional regulator with XRE-family HTH domain
MPRQKAEWFGPKLKALREAAGLTQAELGQRIGVVGSQINKLELGTNQPTLATAAALAKALGVSLGAFDREDEPPPAKPKRRGKK